MDNVSEFLFSAAIVAVVMSVIVLLWGLPLMWLWNWIMPTVFGLQTITFWQAVGLNFISHILFKSNGNTKSGSK
jgi:hypothetical protein